MTTVNNEVVDRLASACKVSIEGGEFTDLFYELKPFVQYEAKKRATRTGYPAEDFESVFWEAVWESVGSYNNSSHFVQRLHFFFNKAAIDVARYYRSEKRGGKAETYSMDANIFHEQEEYREIKHHHEVLPVTTSVEEEYFQKNDKEKLLKGFARANEQHSKIVNSLHFGLTTHEIAKVMGANHYDARVRKTIQRARDNFRKYVDAYWEQDKSQ